MWAARKELVEDPRDGVTMIFIADYYNALVRAVGPDGLIRNVTDEGRLVLGSPSRVAFDTVRNRLYVADSSNNQIVAIATPNAPPRPRLVGRAFFFPGARVPEKSLYWSILTRLRRAARRLFPSGGDLPILLRRLPLGRCGIGQKASADSLPRKSGRPRR